MAPRSGKHIVIPEIDRVQFFSLDDARSVINPAQTTLLDRLVSALNGRVRLGSRLELRPQPEALSRLYPRCIRGRRPGSGSA